MPVRIPVVAGMFYEKDFGKLNSQIEGCFHSKSGPGDLPTRRKETRLYGIVSPHAGYQYSGPCQAWAYKEVAESSNPSVFVIIGPDHNCIGNKFSISLNDWRTPFGFLRTDRIFASSLIEKCSLVRVNEEAHAHEHSVEVQLPFLQFAMKDRMHNLKVVCITISDYSYEDCLAMSKALVKVSKDICVIASSDFTHYGPMYNYLPFVHNKKIGIYNLDGTAIEAIKMLDAESMAKTVKKNRMTICGAGAIATAIETVKLLGAKEGNLLQYYTSGDITGDYTNAVGYASISFR